MFEKPRSFSKAMGGKYLRSAQEASSVACAILCVLIGTFLAASIDWNSTKPLQGVRKAVSLAPVSDTQTNLDGILQALSIAETNSESKRSKPSGDVLQRMAVKVEIDGTVGFSQPVLELRLFRIENSKFWQIDPNDPKKIALPLDEIAVSNRSASLVTFKPTSSNKTTIVGVFDTHAKWKPKIYIWDASQLPTVNMSFERTGGALFGLSSYCRRLVSLSA
jgi:hypothetical protein